MKVSINAKTIKQVVTAETASVANQEVQAEQPSADTGQPVTIPKRQQPAGEKLLAGPPEFAGDVQSSRNWRKSALAAP